MPSALQLSLAPKSPSLHFKTPRVLPFKLRDPKFPRPPPKQNGCLCTGLNQSSILGLAWPAHSLTNLNEIGGRHQCPGPEKRCPGSTSDPPRMPGFRAGYRASGPRMGLPGQVFVLARFAAKPSTKGPLDPRLDRPCLSRFPGKPGTTGVCEINAHRNPVNL